MTTTSSPQAQHDDDLGFELPEAAKTSRVGIIAVFAIVVGGVFAFGYFRHEHAHGAVAGEHDTSLVKVEVIHPAILSSDAALSLPGRVTALEETKLYPRAPGYVKKWLVDIGDKVQAGQLLAEIDVPDLDAQLAQARAQLAQAKASVAQATAQAQYSTQNATRYQGLGNQNLVAPQTVEQNAAQAASDKATVQANQANVLAQQANVERLEQLTAFSHVIAPFAGTITARTIDVGALVSDNGTTPMFTIDATDPIRVFVDVPQTVAPSVRAGTAAKVSVREFPDRPFLGTVTRAAGALDPDLHLMSTEVDVPNKDGALMPGMYADVSITLAVPHEVTEIPATALYQDSHGIRVAVVDAQNKVHYQPITIDRDAGATLWVATGVTARDRVIKLAVPSLVEGDIVDATDVTPVSPVAAKGSAAPAGSAAAGSAQ